MKIKYGHLTYCSNIHPGESWKDHFANLKEYLPQIKKKISPELPFGIGLRLSNEASLNLILPKNLETFRAWLIKEDLYLICINGFPFGGFHEGRIKEKVYHPDWLDEERSLYTIRLFKILSALLPEGGEGGVSTPPLSYFDFWNEHKSVERNFELVTKNIIEVLGEVSSIGNQKSQILHLDIEPEPDGVLGNVQDLIDWYLQHLLPQARTIHQAKSGFSNEDSDLFVKKHIRVCLDACHLAVSYEDPDEILSLLRSHQIQVGRLQVSSALKVSLTSQVLEKQMHLKQFDEPMYLHQVIQRSDKSELTSFRDLSDALSSKIQPDAEEWRIHFHIPIFAEGYGLLSSTQSDLLDLLGFQKKYHFTKILEVETYTWALLPKDLQVNIENSIIRELEWVQLQLNE